MNWQAAVEKTVTGAGIIVGVAARARLLHAFCVIPDGLRRDQAVVLAEEDNRRRRLGIHVMRR